MIISKIISLLVSKTFSVILQIFNLIFRNMIQLIFAAFKLLQNSCIRNIKNSDMHGVHFYPVSLAYYTEVFTCMYPATKLMIFESLVKETPM